MNRMLISTTQENEVRVALIKDKVLYDLDIERPGFEQKKGNIYKGRISRIEPSLEAAFVEYGAEKHGFLPFREVAHSYFQHKTTDLQQRIQIKDALTEGMEVIVQIDKEERGTKGAALTTFISLAGSYLVLMPNNPRVGGISRRIAGKERDDLRDSMRNLNLPEGMGAIIRTAGVGKSTEDLQWDLDALLKQWNAICEANKAEGSTPCLIHQEGDAILRAIRDYLRQEIAEIIVDNVDLYNKTKQYMQQVKPDFIDRMHLYQERIPLFSLYQIEQQIESAHQRIIKLPSGGSIVIDHTEALVSIDVNSAKSTGGSDIEETALNTNLEASDEIARQLRLRDIGGLIVIDFIDMSILRNQREVSKQLRSALTYDRAKVQVGNITKFGLLEMSRQRLRPYIGASNQIQCPRCDGQGTIRSIESLSSSIVNLITEEATKEKTLRVEVQLPIDLAAFLVNEKRNVLVEIEQQGSHILILPNQHLQTPQYKIKRIRVGDPSIEVSYKMLEFPETVKPEKQEVPEKSHIEPIVKSTLANVTHRTHPQAKKSVIFNIYKTLSQPLALISRLFNHKTSSHKQTAKVQPLSLVAEQKKLERTKNFNRYKSTPMKHKHTYSGIKESAAKSHSRRGSRGGKKYFNPPNTDAYPEITAEPINTGSNFTIKQPNQSTSIDNTKPEQEQGTDKQ